MPCYECGAARESNRRGRCGPCAVEADRQYQKAYYAEWKDRNLKHWKEYQRAYYQANREERIAYSVARNQADRAGANARIRKWKRANPHKVAEYEGRRRARKLENGYEPIDPREVFNRDGWICHLCGEPVAPEYASLDHIQPLSRGGSHTYDNVATAHTRCNIARGSRLLERVPKEKDWPGR